MKARRKHVILALSLLAAGGLRMSWEAALTREFRSDSLLARPVETGTREKIGQTSAAVALGGLRTLVATFLNLKAYSHFEAKEWSELAETYDQIVDLAPNTPYYWTTGGWHLAYNSASDYLTRRDLPALRRREGWNDSIRRGRAFYERGARLNPGEPTINAELGTLLSNANKLVDFPAAAAAFKAAADTGKALPYVCRRECLALARIPGREHEALVMARQLYAAPHNRIPVLCCVLFAMECRADPTKNPMKLAISIFGDARSAHEQLGDYWVRVRERFPLDGVASALKNLEVILLVPTDESVFNRPLPLKETPDDWFRGR